LIFSFNQLDASRTKIIIPTPALSEVLVHADQAGPEYLNRLQQSSVFRIESFDQRAAIEVAFMIREAIMKGDKRSGSKEQWAKVKFDRQIVAIAKVNDATAIYSDDTGIRSFAQLANISVVGLGDLPLPPKEAQIEMWPKK
jgi:hypothetical protein